jgi:hypothetical protein
MPTNRVYKFVTLILLLPALAAIGFAQNNPDATPQNLVRGVVGPVSSSGNWANYSLINEIPGAGLFPITSSTTVFYFGFTAGTTADISNMVLYTTARGSQKITAVTPVTLGGVSNPSIKLSNTSVCPVQPLSTSNPCIVRFDPVAITLATSSDCYLAVYFANDSNNSSIGGAVATAGGQSLSGQYVSGVDETHLAVGQSIPLSTSRQPYFLMYVTNN